MGKKRSSKLWVTCVSEARSEWMAQSVIDSCTTRWLNSLSAHSFISVSWPLLLSKFGQPSWLALLPFNWFIHTSRYLKSESIPKWHPISLFCEWIRFFYHVYVGASAPSSYVVISRLYVRPCLLLINQDPCSFCNGFGYPTVGCFVLSDSTIIANGFLWLFTIMAINLIKSLESCLNW